MNKLKSLTLIQLKDFLGNARRGLNVKNSKLGSLLQLLALAALATPAINFSILTFNSFAQLGQPELVITSMYVNSVLLMFFLGIPFIVSVFFYSKDIYFLSSLPLREDTIVFAKLSTVYLYLLGLNTLLVAPSIVIYLLNSGFRLVVVLMGTLALILAPLLPLLISALLVLLLNRFLINKNRKNLLAIIGNLLLIIVIIAIQIIITRYITDPEYLQQSLRSKEGLLGFIGLRFPPSIWLTKMILGSWRDTLLFFGINIFFWLALQSLAKTFYRKALNTFSQTAGGSGQIYYRQRSQAWQLLKRHIMIILKEPTFMLNTLLTLIVPVLLYMVMALSGQLSLELFNSPEVKPYLPLIFTGLLTAPALIGSNSATAITREGQAFWETKVLPVSARDNLHSRVLTTVIFSLSGTVLMLLISLVALPVTFGMVILGSVFALIATLFFATVDLIINIYRPLLSWTNPTAAVKNNLNVTISLAIRAVIGLAFYLIYRLLPGLVTGNLELTIVVSAVVFFIFYLVSRGILYTSLVKKFSEISL